MKLTNLMGALSQISKVKITNHSKLLYNGLNYLLLLVLITSAFGLKAQTHMAFTTDLKRSNGLLAWRPPSTSLANAVDHYVLEIYRFVDATNDFELVEKFSYSNNYALFPENYLGDGDLFYQVIGKDADGIDIVYSDFSPVCEGCTWEETKSWGCYAKDFAYKIVQLTNNNGKVFYKLDSYSTISTQSQSAEYFSNTAPNGAYASIPYWVYPKPNYPGPFKNKTGSLLSGTIYGRKLPLGPSPNGGWGSNPRTDILSPSGANNVSTIGSAINIFNSNRAASTSTGNPQISLNCNVKYPGPTGVLKGPYGNADAKPLEISDDIKVQLVCYKYYWAYVGKDENGNDILAEIAIQVPCDGINPNSLGNLSNSSLHNIVSAIAGENNHFDENAITYSNIESVMIRELSGMENTFSVTYQNSDLFDESGTFIFDDTETTLSPGVYQTTTLYNGSFIGLTTFLVPDENQVSSPSFNATIYPVPNNGEYNLKITSEELKEFQYEVYDLDGNYYFNESVNILDFATEIIKPIALSVDPQPVYGQLIHKITGEDGQVQIIQTTFNSN